MTLCFPCWNILCYFKNGNKRGSWERTLSLDEVWYDPLHCNASNKVKVRFLS